LVLWFAGLSFALVWLAFRSPALDYRLVVAGSLVPLADLVTGGTWVLHTVVAGALTLVVVMVTTRRRRLLRRRWLGVPIGMMLHLVLDGTWADAELFWWPVLGGDVLGDAAPESGRSLPVLVVLEAVGVAVGWWCWRRFGLDDAARRRRFLRTGQLDPALTT
jgi:hypothetical protein